MSIRGVLSDFRDFVLCTPPVPTLVECATEEEREEYSQRILQRIGKSVAGYSVLNIHRIGIDVPARYVFEEFLSWDADSTFWPNHLATVGRVDGGLDHIDVFLFGRRKPLFGVGKGIFGVTPLFRMDAVAIAHRPNPADFDNARYLLYECSGGYPIGIFAVYVRSPIAARGEATTQVFSAVGFNFYGRQEWLGRRLVSAVWERVHNRVTCNVLNRFKAQCEDKFRSVVANPSVAADPGVGGADRRRR